MSDDPVREALISMLETLDLGRVGRVGALVVKPRECVHDVRDEVYVRAGEGFVGDHPYKSFWKGELMPGREVTALSGEVAAVLGFEPTEVGDNLVTTGLDLRSLNPGDRIRLGSSVILERSGATHRPCAKFRERTSPVAYDITRTMNYRGALFVVVEGGRLCLGDPIEVIGDQPLVDPGAPAGAFRQ